MSHGYSLLPRDDTDNTLSFTSHGDNTFIREDNSASHIATEDVVSSLSDDSNDRIVLNGRPTERETTPKLDSLSSVLCFIRKRYAGVTVSIIMLLGGLLMMSISLYFGVSGLKNIKIDQSIDSFKVPDHIAVTRVHLLEHAVKDFTKSHRGRGTHIVTRDTRRKRAVSYDDIFGHPRRRCFKHQNVSIILLASKDGKVDPYGDMFRPDRLELLSNLQKKLDNANATVWRTGSILSSIRNWKMFKDWSAISAKVKKHKAFAKSSYLDGTVFAVNGSSRFLKIKVILQCGPKERMLRGFIDLVKDASTPAVTVIYGNNDLFSLQVLDTFYGDLSLVWISVALIVGLMFVFSSSSLWPITLSSVALTVWGLICIVGSFLVAFLVYTRMAHFESLGILNGAGTFLILGVGIDDVFVFINVYKQAPAVMSVNQKVIHTIKTAGIATFLTSFTTAAAFTGNIVSPIRALSQFGVFMTSVVLSCWVLIFLTMPAVLAMVESIETFIEKYIYARACPELCSAAQQCSTSCSLRIPHDIAMAAQKPKPASCDGSTEDSDVPMLQLVFDDPSTEPSDTTSDVDAVSLTTSVSPSPGEGHSVLVQGITGFIQFSLYKITSLLIKGKWFIFGLFLALLAVSAGLDSQLSTSSDTLQLFKNGTNLQLWNEFRESMTRQDIQCDSCSSDYLNDGNIEPIMPPYIPSGFRTTKQPVSKKTTMPTSPHYLMPTTTPTTVPVIRTTLPPYKTDKPKWTTRPSYTKPLSIKTNPYPVTTSRTPTQKIPENVPTVPKQPVYPPTRATSTTAAPSIIKPTAPSLSPAPVAKASDDTAIVYVVFGLKGLQRQRNGDHVVEEDADEKVIYDNRFSTLFNFTSFKTDPTTMLFLENLGNLKSALKAMCQVCKEIAANRDLVLENGADCLTLPKSINASAVMLKYLLEGIPQCSNLPHNGKMASGETFNKFTALAATTKNDDSVLWLSFAFKSTTKTSGHYYEAYKVYQAWEDEIDKHQKTLPSSLQSIFQTSSFWEDVIREVASVNSAIYSVGFSLLVSAWSVATFMAHPGLLLIIITTIIAEVSMVTAIFWMLGWSVGPVEAICLSILVGTAVDYCVHITEAYLIVGKNMPESYKKGKAGEARSWRSVSAVTHIGSSVLGSALTTIMAAIPLTQAAILPFAKFGVIMLINTAVSMAYSLLISPSILAAVGPAKWISRLRWHILSASMATFLAGSILLCIYLLSSSKVIALPLGSISAN